VSGPRSDRASRPFPGRDAWVVVLALAAMSAVLSGPAAAQTADGAGRAAPPRTDRPPASLAVPPAKPRRGAAARARQPAEPLRLRALFVYDGAEAKDAHQTILYQLLELPANHLGLRCDYLDATGSLPSPSVVRARYRGVVTWLTDDSLAGADRYLRWLRGCARLGVRVLMLDGLGAFSDPKTRAPADPELIRETLSALGLRRSVAGATQNPLDIELVSKQSAVVEWERPLRGELLQLDPYRALEPDAKVYLRLRRRRRPEVTADAVVVTRHGGLVAPGYVVWDDPAPPYVTQWRVDPYRLLEEAFSLEGLPRPDPTTALGARLALSQIDGDGLESLSRVEPGKLCAEVMLTRVLKHAPLLTTIGFIGASLDPKGTGAGIPRRLAIARAIFALPGVEPASHTLTHPFDWTRGTAAYRLPGYTYDPAVEVLRSVAYLDRVVSPPGKPVRVVLWSGNCTPPPRALAACSDLGLWNLNGGESRRDALLFASSELRPFGRVVGGHLQVHAPMPNENVYSNAWSGPYDGLRQVLETWKRTGTPRRTHAVDLFYHFYSAERRASLRALAELFRWVRQQPDLHPVFVSRYAAGVDGFQAARLTRRELGVFEVSGYGALSTIRFDDEERVPDLARSEGVLGWLRRGHSLYVHLRPGRSARIALASAGRLGPQPRIELSTVPVRAFERPGPGALHLEAWLAPWGRLTLAGLPPGGRCRVERGAKPTVVLPVDGRGRVVIPLPGSVAARTEGDPVRIDVSWTSPRAPLHSKPAR